VKDYTKFTVEEFVQDEAFQQWILRPHAESELFWQTWMADHPESATVINEARAIVRQIRFSEYTLPAGEIASLWQRIQTGATKPGKAQRRGGSLFYKVAASLILIASVLFLYERLLNDGMVEYNTAYGETKTITLPDSSTVILNSNSTMKIPAAWQAHHLREIWLEGEAFFSVKHTIDHQPFKVNVKDGPTVEVLGTSFNVYHRVKETKVVLNTGKIKLHMPADTPANNIVMKPGDMVEYKEKSYSRRSVDPAVYSAWTEKKLILDHTSLREMVDMLRNNYGVEVEVRPDALLSQTVSGSMPLAEAEDLLRQIAGIFQLKVVKDSDRYIIQE